MADPTTNLAAEFQALPLEYIVTSPLTAAVKAQRATAEATKDFIQGMIGDDSKPITVDFQVEHTEGGDGLPMPEDPIDHSHRPD